METGHVECYSGHTYAQRPRAFVWQERRCFVSCVESQWRTSDGPVFRVCIASGHCFTLAYDEVADEWDIRPS